MPIKCPKYGKKHFILDSENRGRKIRLKKGKLFNVIKLMRPKHYIKNLLVFVSLTFDGNLFCAPVALKVFGGFLSFSLLSSAIYTINDIQDRKADQQHEIKKKRPIASGAISVYEGGALAAVLIAVSALLHCTSSELRWKSLLIMGGYFAVNLGYSLGLKQIPFVDIVLLVSGFLLRVLYGAVIIDSKVSAWVYLTVTSLSFYLGLGKRRNEQKKLAEHGTVGNTRAVLSYYSYAFLDKFMYVCLTLSVAFYALWSADKEIAVKYGTDKLVWTVPLVLIILMKYSADIETDSYGDPVDVVLHDKALLLLGILFGIVLLGLIYF